MYRLNAILVSSALLFACSDNALPPQNTGEFFAERFDIYDGSAEALGVLDLLNDPATTEAVLDLDVALDIRAARSIIDYRDGKDGEAGTSDDRLFTDLESVDDRYYVGDAALEAILRYAVFHGYVALYPDDILGTWDGVTFTLGSAECVVVAVNETDLDVLDDDVGLDSRAVNSIAEARPIHSVLELAGLWYVGTSALTKLQDCACGLGEETTDKFTDLEAHLVSY